MKAECYEFKAKCFYTLGTIVLILSLTFMLVSCSQNDFELNTNINPELALVSGDIAVQFQLGDMTILDEWTNLNAGQTLFLLGEEKKKQYHLKIRATDGLDGVIFTYTITGGIEIKTNPVKFSILSKSVTSFPNVIWKVKDGKTISKKDQKVEEDGLRPTEGSPETGKSGLEKLQ